MGEVSKCEGRTVLFVSHQMSAIRNLCNNCLLLQNGRLKTIGTTEDVVSFYIAEGNKNSNRNIKYYDKHLKYVSIKQTSSIIVIEAEYDSNINYDRSAGTRKGKIIINVEDPKLTDGEYIASIWFGDSTENYIEDLECLSFEVSSMTLNKQYSSSQTGNVIPKTSWKFEKYE
jgi:lipopolysaccharide transport system ATP-binding protein